MARLSKAITLVTVKGLITQYENEYVTEEAKVTEIEVKSITYETKLVTIKPTSLKLIPLHIILN